jgi:hypothetical protein
MLPLRIMLGQGQRKRRSKGGRWKVLKVITAKTMRRQCTKEKEAEKLSVTLVKLSECNVFFS